MDLADSSRRSCARLLLRSLRICQHYGARHRDVHTLSCGDRRGRCAHRAGRFVSYLLRKLERRSYALRHHTCSGLFRDRLRYTETLVDRRADRLCVEYYYLDRRGTAVVEISRLVVRK